MILYNKTLIFTPPPNKTSKPKRKMKKIKKIFLCHTEIASSKICLDRIKSRVGGLVPNF